MSYAIIIVIVLVQGLLISILVLDRDEFERKLLISGALIVFSVISWVAPYFFPTRGGDYESDALWIANEMLTLDLWALGLYVLAIIIRHFVVRQSTPASL